MTTIPVVAWSDDGVDAVVHAGTLVVGFEFLGQTDCGHRFVIPKPGANPATHDKIFSDPLMRRAGPGAQVTCMECLAKGADECDGQETST